MRTHRLFCLLLALSAGVILHPYVAGAQTRSDPSQGDNKWTQRGVLDGNRVRTLYTNHGEIGLWPEQPSGEWPKGSAHSYLDGVAFIVSAETQDAQGNTIHPMSTNYREFIDRDPVTKVPWGFAPLPGYSNPRQPSPARSDDARTWPALWPDRPADWAGQWNGFFGKGVQNADLETYFVFDDSPDREYTLAPHRFFPCPGDTTRGGLGLEVRARGLQWNHPLAEDVIFWLYEITNECETDFNEVFFAQYIDWGVGGTDDSGDDEGAYDTQLDLAFAWDFDGRGTPGQWSPVGTSGYAFLESPGNFTDGSDNDEDGITDERRDSGPGTLVEGQDAIRAYVEANYDLADFAAFYLSLEDRPAFQAGRWWTGDEEMDWTGFRDANDNAQWDPGELLNDDVGADGLDETNPNYPGRDLGEGDGQPTPGEPNFDALDKDESDQIGLTGFSVFDVHRYELIDDEENFRIFSEALPPLDDIVLEGGRNLGMFFASGPFPLAAGQTERFSMALLFAEKDFNDPRDISNSALARKKETVQQIYNADYRFARPPNKPTLTAIPGDGQVTLVWDEIAERSFDPFLREFDFEGYLIYRSTEPFFEENKDITDAYGELKLQKPIAQFDLKNGLRGLHPVGINGVQVNIGTDSGLQHSYVDRDVRNGETYYYAVVAYDRGLVNRDAAGNPQTDLAGNVRGLSPSFTTSRIDADVAGNVSTDINTAVATPRAPAAGYVAPEVETFESDTRGTGSVSVEIVMPELITQPTTYEITFDNLSVWQDSSVSGYTLRNVTADTTLAEGLIEGGREEVPPAGGIFVNLQMPEAVAVIDSTVRFSDDGGTFFSVVLPASDSPVTSSRFIALPNDFSIHFTDAVADTSLRLSLGMREMPVNFYVENLTTGRRQPFVIIEDVDSLQNGLYDHGDRIVLVMGDAPDTEPVLQGGRWRASWSIRIIPPDPDINPENPRIPPQPGSTLRFRTQKPFQTGDRVTFSLTPAAFDTEQASADLDDVYVVPNPYVAASTFEPPNNYRTGRGERRIYFMNLPPECTVRIYTITGQLVQTLEHNASVDDGQLAWDLTTRDGMNLAYGVYIYHVEAPGVGEFISRFAVIK